MWFLLEHIESSVFSMSLNLWIFHQRLVLVMPHPDYKHHFGLWSTFPNCSLNCCWQFTLVTFFGELSWGTCRCSAWEEASRQWLPMWWYESPAPLPQGEKASGALLYSVPSNCMRLDVIWSHILAWLFPFLCFSSSLQVFFLRVS